MPRLTEIRKQALDEMMKEALFDATVAVLSVHGVDGLTMDRVASEAGIAKGSVYRYFRSKQDLLEFVFAKLVDPIFEDLRETVESDQPAIDKLSHHLYTLFEHVAQHAQVHKLLFEDDTAHGLLQSSERNTFSLGSQLLTKVFRQGIEEKVFRQVDPYMLAVMYIGIFRGILQSQPDLEKREHRENIHHLVMETLLEGISSKSGSAAG